MKPPRCTLGRRGRGLALHAGTLRNLHAAGRGRERVAAFRALPQSKPLSIRLGIALGVLGILLVLVSFSGNFAYDIRFFYLAVLGTFLGAYGMVLLANSRVLSTKRPARRPGAERAAEAPRVPAGPAPAGPEWVRVQCPRCGEVFEAGGTRPFHAACPRCAARGLIA